MQIFNSYREQAERNGKPRNSKAKCSGVTILKPVNGDLVVVEQIRWRNLKNNKRCAKQPKTKY